MKRRILFLLMALMLIANACPPVLAVDTSDPAATEAADCLYRLGLFTGTGTSKDGKPNYDLARAPTRQEAVTMLVRLLGKEDEAKRGNWQTPFTDVDSWAAPYVGYAYENGLTNGMGATTFGGNQSVSAAQYITFILRALGYSSKTDFAWDRAWEKSDALSITDGSYSEKNNTSFTRADVAKISSSALATGMKDSGSSLLSHLLAAGAVTEADAWGSGLMYTAYARTLLTMDGERHTIQLEDDRFVDSNALTELLGEYDAYTAMTELDNPQPLQLILTQALRTYTAKCLDGDYAQMGVPAWNEFSVSEKFRMGALFTDAKGNILGYGVCEDPTSDEFTIVTAQTDSRPFISASVKNAKAELACVPEISCRVTQEDGTYVFHFEDAPEGAVWMEKMMSGFSVETGFQWAVDDALMLVSGWSRQERKNACTDPIQNPFIGESVSNKWPVAWAVFVFLDADYNIVGYSLGQT